MAIGSLIVTMVIAGRRRPKRSVRQRGCKSVVDHLNGGIAPRAQSEFLEGRRDMAINGGRAEPEKSAYLLAAEMLSDENQDLALPRTQRFDALLHVLHRRRPARACLSVTRSPTRKLCGECRIVKGDAVAFRP